MKNDDLEIRPIILVTEISYNHDINENIRNKATEIITCINSDSKSLGAKKCKLIKKNYFITPSKEVDKVDFNSILDELCELNYFSNENLLQPIVLFILDGTTDYTFSWVKFSKFTRSYIYNNSLRMISWFGKLSSNNTYVLNMLGNKNVDIEEMKTFGANNPRFQLSCALTAMEGNRGYTCIVEHRDRKLKIVNGYVKYN